MNRDLPNWLIGPDAQSPDDRLRACIPAPMKGAKRWLMHRNKRPFYVDGTPRSGKLDSAEDTARLATIDEAIAASRTGAYSGLGFALGDGWQGIDMDKVATNGFESLVADLPGYVERSPSGNGWHAIGYGESFPTLGANQTGIEAYCGARFFTVTGDQGRGAIADLSNFVAARLAPMHSARQVGPDTSGTTASIVCEGGRNTMLASMAGSMRSRGMSHAAIEAALQAENLERCNPPLDQSEVKRIAKSVSRYEPTRDAANDDASALFGPVQQQESWGEPIPLPNALPSVMPFDAALLPDALRPWAMDIAHRMQCPADFPAVAALVALSSLIGARAVIQPKAKDDWQVVPNLWGAVVGRPGVKKSPALGEALKPLHRLQHAEFERWQAAHDAWQLDCRLAELQADGNQRKAKGIASTDPATARALLVPVSAPAEPMARRFVVNDATVEKLGEIMQHNTWGTLSYRDELYGLLTSLDKQGQEGSRAFYLQSYDGNQGYTFDRIGRGTVQIPRVCLSMVGGIQPGRIQEYVRGAVTGGSADDGLLQRFGLAVWPDVASDFTHIDQWPDTPAKQAAWSVFERLAALQPISDTEPSIWRFTPEAQALFVEWLVPFETELRGDSMHPALVSHLAKYRKLVPALALVFALIDTPDSGGAVGWHELNRALGWEKYLRSHANRLYAAAVTPETSDAATLLAKIRAGKLADADGVMPDSFTPRQIALKGWAGLVTPNAVRVAADMLSDYGWLRKETSQPGQIGGRPSERYMINTAALISPSQ